MSASHPDVIYVATGEGMQVKKIVEEAGIPIFMTVGGDPPIMKETGPFTYIFKSPQRSSTAIKKVFEYLKEKKLTKVAMFTASDPFGKDGAVWLEKLAPHEPVSQYRHNVGEDNADAHLKRSVMGREVVVAVTDGALDFGPWEQIFYGEFDGQRRKRVLVKIIGE